jgi:hypothetical protein
LQCPAIYSAIPLKALHRQKKTGRWRRLLEFRRKRPDQRAFLLLGQGGIFRLNDLVFDLIF